MKFQYSNQNIFRYFFNSKRFKFIRTAAEMNDLFTKASSSADSAAVKSLTFVPFTSFIDPTFWSEVNRRKVAEWKLDSSERSIIATFSASGKQPTGASLCVSSDSFEITDEKTGGFERLFTTFPMRGKLRLTNTKKEFVELDRKAILNQLTHELWTLIESRRWLVNPNLLNCFYLTAYADIKRYVYYFWNCVPALLHSTQICSVGASQRLTNDDKRHAIALEFLRHACERQSEWAFFAFVLIDDKTEGVKAHPISTIDFANISQAAALSAERVTLVFLNASLIADRPAWTLRNLLSAVAFLRPDWHELKVMTLRRLIDETFLLQVRWQALANGPKISELISNIKAVGWERDPKTDALTYRRVELKSMFDPLQIMEQSADLNLKLIRWQQAPTIQLERLANLRALILGAGTLGCNVARCLLGWGVRYFTFVDHATVSYNNPIRQSLFTFEDCKRSAFHKAEAAAFALQRIFPCVESRGIDMKIPMPGHPYSDQEKESVINVCEELDELIQGHNVVFLVMDSRESRWLPTLIAAHYDKLAITVALGFDSYVVIRHGATPSEDQMPNSETNKNQLGPASVVPGAELGCYFCSDVTAPGNSTADRTLDQQCTISRSGLSMIASGLAVELLASVLQHERMGNAACALLADVDENSGVLGATPHQIRGFLSRFHQMTPTVRRFAHCSACGEEVRRHYAKFIAEKNAGERISGFNAFLHKVFHDPKALERITGLADLQESVEMMQLDMLAFDEDDDKIDEVTNEN